MGKISHEKLLAPMCSGYGQTHSDKIKPFTSIDLAGIRALVDNPQSVGKALAQWLIPSTLASRTFKEQELKGSYHLLWFDLDKEPKPLIEVSAFIAGLLPDCNYEIYASRSATIDNQKARILIPLADPLNFNDWHACQSILNEKLNASGFTPDPANLRAAQLCYLPNRGEFYASYSQRDNDLFQPLTAWHSEIETLRQAQLDKVKELETLSKAAKAKREALSVNDLADTIGAFNNAYSVHEILTMAGYAQRGDTFRHPNSESGSFSASVKNNRVHTLSTNDPLYSDGKGAHDAFSAFTVLFANGDHNQALKLAGDSWLSIAGESYNTVKQREFMQSKPLFDVTALLNAHNAPTDDLKQAGDVVERIESRKRSMMATRDTIAHMANLKHHIDGLALQAHHTYIFGDSGSFKTTFITALCMKAIEANPEIEVHYWGFDVSPPYVKAVVDLVNEMGIQDRFYLFSDQTIIDMQAYYKDYLDGKIRLDNTIIVLDTFKFLSNDVNGKNANKDAMHYIKSICKLGASWLSIGHTNKDGVKQSGTAEIEQDSDGILRIDSCIDGEAGTANIKKGGRCRWGEPNLTIKTSILKEDKSNPSHFWYEAIKSAQVVDNVDIEKVKYLREISHKLKIVGEIIHGYFMDNQTPLNKTELSSLIKSNELLDLSQQKKIDEILRAGEGIHWKSERHKSDNNKLLFSPCGLIGLTFGGALSYLTI